MRDNSKYKISHSYTKISQTGTQFPMHPLKTICTVKMAWHNRGKCSGTQWVNLKRASSCCLQSNHHYSQVKILWPLNNVMIGQLWSFFFSWLNDRLFMIGQLWSFFFHDWMIDFSWLDSCEVFFFHDWMIDFSWLDSCEVFFFRDWMIDFSWLDSCEVFFFMIKW